MKLSSAIAILFTSVALTACASNISSEAPAMKDAQMTKDAKMMDGKHAMKDGHMMKDKKMMDAKHAMKDGHMMKDAKMMKDGKMMDGKHAMKGDKMMKDSMMKDSTMMKGESCHDHAANSMTKSSNHCHQSSQANHTHQYGG